MINNFNISKKLIQWYKKYGRKKLPWRKNISIYTTWISEIMLQQTQVSRVIPYFIKFIKYLPKIHYLFNININKILYLWSGLGYYNRAINIYNASKIISKKFQGNFPTKFKDVVSLPGIGKSTAGAILSIALKKKYAILDINVKRILLRLFLIKNYPNTYYLNNILWNIINEIIPKKNINIFNQSIMDFGSLTCTKKKPKCNICILKKNCRFYNLSYDNINLIKNTKTKKSQKKIFFLLLQKKKYFLLQKNNTKIWPKLFCFPIFKKEKYINFWLKKNKLLILQKINKLNVISYNIGNTKYLIYLKHIKTNFSFKKKSKKKIWYNIKKSKIIGIPSLVKKILLKL